MPCIEVLSQPFLEKDRPVLPRFRAYLIDAGTGENPACGRAPATLGTMRLHGRLGLVASAIHPNVLWFSSAKASSATRKGPSEWSRFRDLIDVGRSSATSCAEEPKRATPTTKRRSRCESRPPSFGAGDGPAMSTLTGRVLSLIGVAFALIVIFVLEGISIELLGLILGGLGYYFGLRGQDRSGQLLAIVAVVLNVISIFVSGLEGPPQ